MTATDGLDVLWPVEPVPASTVASCSRFGDFNAGMDSPLDYGFQCDVCGCWFDEERQRDLHKGREHVAPPSGQWDLGQLDMRRGVDMLWDGFMRTHDLPRVVFLFGPVFADRSARYVADSYVPAYLEDGVVDLVTGEDHPTVLFPPSWFLLPAHEKAAALAHTAAHAENRRHDVWDVTRGNYHRISFARVARTYGLQPRMAPQSGWSVVVGSAAFRERHAKAIDLLGRFHPLRLKRGEHPVRCYPTGKSGKLSCFRQSYMSQWDDFSMDPLDTGRLDMWERIYGRRGRQAKDGQDEQKKERKEP